MFRVALIFVLMLFLFSGPAGIFQFAANVSQPIFNAGRIGYNVNATEARRDQALAQYKQAVASAFGDVRNALASQEAARQVLEAETVRSKSLFQASQQASLPPHWGSGAGIAALQSGN